MNPAWAAFAGTAVLAVLLGVNFGPNLTYTGSLATLLWREFTTLGLLTVPAGLLIAVLALWGDWLPRLKC